MIEEKDMQFIKTPLTWRGVLSLIKRFVSVEVTADVGAAIDDATAKTTPVDADLFAMLDSAASFVLKKISFSNLKTAIRSYILGIANTFTKTLSITPVVLTSTTNAIAVNAALSNNFTHTLSENTTVAAPTNLVEGTIYNFAFKQHASSAKTLAFNAAFLFPGGTDPVISATLGSLLLVRAHYLGGVLLCEFTQNHA